MSSDSTVDSQATVAIGNHLWMMNNLNVDKFQNGDPIPFAESNEDWIEAGNKKQPAWCYYNNDPANDEIYGKLYNGFALEDPRGIAPKGFHVPNESEWSEIFFDKNVPEFHSSFTVQQGGYRDDKGVFSNIEKGTFFWTLPTDLVVNYISRKSEFGECVFIRIFNLREDGLSIRCLRD
jgi:hypothetical protein